MENEGEILKFDTSTWECIGNKSDKNVHNCPITIRDLKSGKILDFENFIWKGLNGAFSPDASPKPKIFYNIEIRKDKRILVFQLSGTTK